ncbi:hypothetical protein QOZ80_3AG0223480 [Eleusine coracana subsp. coracana]|nr:hypothetical protein QOZ80_3AG0223480 [Eleusine coracana subsp. coracana]
MRRSAQSMSRSEEDTCTIRLDHEHYTGHIKDHKVDAEYLNKPIEHYDEMFIIFGNSLATGKFAKGSSEPLGTQVTENEDECDEVYVSAAAATPVHEDNSATSSAPKPKKAKTSHNEEEDGLIATFKSLPGFDVSHVDDYFDYFVEHPSKARAFMQLSFDRKLSRFANFISEQEK